MKAGITGHQDLVNRSTSIWVREAITRNVLLESVTIGLTSLAAGADQLFADVLRGLGVPYIGVIPSQAYDKVFKETSGRRRFRFLRSEADGLVRLDNPKPTASAFYAAGRYIADETDVLLAVWDGKPAKGLGGTADIVKYAMKIRRRIIHIDLLRRHVVHL